MSMFSKLKQFKDLRDQGKKMQELLGSESATGQGASGKVVVTLDGNLNMSGVAIDPSLLSADNKQKVESGIKDAYGDALKKVQRIMATKMQESGFKMPEL